MASGISQEELSHALALKDSWEGCEALHVQIGAGRRRVALSTGSSQWRRRHQLRAFLGISTQSLLQAPWSSQLRVADRHFIPRHGEARARAGHAAVATLTPDPCSLLCSLQVCKVGVGTPALPCPFQTAKANALHVGQRPP